ncbi:unnamed protein product [Zymoseptoria tritici ST99CH_1E4]|uniref:LysM domain-containing protein n=1 Tax=Zymoseptoria tritici ST99CH_1E4 TaxID=1276532 RepID=A0A2H1GPX8_ZYMTR|nr:unnamed protein product [Zymoseptoria tritici ST99CH_1E4]
MALNTTMFSLYPAMDAVQQLQLAQGFGWSEGCLSAMNMTLNCDSSLFRMAGDVDSYFWSVSNVTQLCTDVCIRDASDWVVKVEESCEDQTYTISGKLVPVDVIPSQFNEGLNFACLKPNYLSITIGSSKDNATGDANSSNSANASLELGALRTSDDLSIFRAGSALFSSNVGNTTETGDPEMTKWCFLVSQNVQGVVAEPDDCENDSDNIFCTDPDSQSRLANLYPDNVLCDPCVLSMMWFRLSSQFLPDNDNSDWLAEQYLDMTDICNATLPEVVIRALPDYAMAPPPPPMASNSTGNITSNATCEDRLITLDTSGCDEQAKKYNISTGDLRFASRSRNCSSTKEICAPEGCHLEKVGFNSSCDALAAAYSSPSLNITTSLFLGWNRHILGLCNNLTMDQYVCASPPGGFYELPPPLPGSDSNGSGPVRGGQGSDSTSSSNSSLTASMSMAPNSTAAGQTSMPITNSTSAVSPTTTLPFPTQSGITPDCNKYMDAKKGDHCSKFAADNGISEEQLYDWNPILGKNGADCDTQFQASTEYCVGISSASSGTSNAATSAAATSNAATSDVATPSSTSSISPPMQSGISSKCNKFDVAKKGDYCSKFATDHGISADDLYTWNPILGENGKDCDTLFQAGVLYCIGVSS